MISSENLSFIYNLNTSPPNREYPLQYAGTVKNRKSHYKRLDSLFYIVPAILL